MCSISPLAAARAIKDETRWAEVLVGLAPHLAEAECAKALGEVLSAVRAIKDEGRRVEVIAKLAPHLAKLPRQRLYSLWQETLCILVTRTRRDLLAEMVSSASRDTPAALNEAEPMELE